MKNPFRKILVVEETECLECKHIDHKRYTTRVIWFWLRKNWLLLFPPMWCLMAGAVFFLKFKKYGWKAVIGGLCVLIGVVALEALVLTLILHTVFGVPI